MNTLDEKYLKLLDYIMSNGKVKKDRTGIGTISVFGYDMRIDLSEGLSLLTTKYVHHPAVLHELLWFLMGGTDIKYLVDNGVKIWNEWPERVYSKVPINQLLDTDCISDPSRVRRHFEMEEYVKAIKSVPGFAERHGRVGKVYGAQWVNWTWPKLIGDGGIDVAWQISRLAAGRPVDEYEIDGYNQMQKLITALKNNPDSRRMLVTAWNPPEMDECALPCCHYAFQCYTTELTVEERGHIYLLELTKAGVFDQQQYVKDLFLRNMGVELKTAHAQECLMHEFYDKLNVPKRKLSLMWIQRSTDVFIGLPFDIASYSILTHLLCKQVNMVPGELIVNSGDTHIYLTHIEQVKEQLKRNPFDTLATLFIKDNVNSIFEYKYADFTIDGYNYHPAIKAPIAI